MSNLDRFSVGLVDRQDQPVTFLEHCRYCQRPIFAGDEAVEEDGDYYRSASCYVTAGDARFVIAGEEE